MQHNRYQTYLNSKRKFESQQLFKKCVNNYIFAFIKLLKKHK